MLNVPINGDNVIGVYFSERHTGGVRKIGKWEQLSSHVPVQFVGLSAMIATWKVEEEDVMCILAGKYVENRKAGIRRIITNMISKQ